MNTFSKGQNPHLLTALFLVIVLSFISITLHVGDFNIRFATIAGDDSFLAFANYDQNQERYNNDFEIQNIVIPGSKSLINSTAMSLSKNFNISTMLLAKIVVYLQSILLAIGIFLLSNHLLKNVKYSLLAVGLSFLSNPLNHNLADYGGLEWMPYMGLSSMAVGLISLLLYYIDKKNLSLLALILTGFIHPSVGVYTCAITFIYICIDFVSS